MSLSLLGATPVGSILEDVFKAGGAIAESAIEQKQAQDISDAAKRDEATKLQAAIAQDVSCATAYAKSPSDATLAPCTRTVLSDTSAQARLSAAQNQLETSDALAKKQPIPYRQNMAAAWRKIVSMIQSGGAPDTGKKTDEKESWFTRRVLGPLPGYGVLALGGGLALVALKLLGRKK
jgi:hypothetical protein